MTARGYSLSLLVGAALLFLATAVANVVLDPERVFGIGIFSHQVNVNERSLKLKLYQHDADSIDGLLFSSSRGSFLDPELLAEDMGSSHLFSASLSYGMITDHLPLLEYIVQDKSSRAVKLKHVFLLLDVDFFGRPPWTNSNINSFLPPQLSGESPGRYWWRYLTAFQFRFWRNVVKEDRLARQRAVAEARLAPALPVNQVAPASAGNPVRSPIPFEPEDYRRSWNRIRVDLDRQLDLLRRLVALCRENQIQLTVAVSPLKAPILDLNGPDEVKALTERLSRITPLWDFNSPPFFASRDEYWLDISHFDEKAGAMMLGRIFSHAGDRDPDWGLLRGRKERAPLDSARHP